MLPLGRLAIRGERGEPRYTKFTRDEQRTLMSLFSIFKSPLMFGGNLTDNDAFTDSLLTNEDVLYMHHYSVNNRQVSRVDNEIVWSADDPATGDKFTALFNIDDADAPSRISLNLTELGYAPNQAVRIRDLWTGAELGTFKNNEFAPAINRHGSGLYRLVRELLIVTG
jgi:hypothetical protein